MRKQLKLQSQVSTDHLKDALEAKERETQRAIDRALSEQVEADTNRYKAQLATVVGRLRGLDAALAGESLLLHPALHSSQSLRFSAFIILAGNRLCDMRSFAPSSLLLLTEKPLNR